MAPPPHKGCIGGAEKTGCYGKASSSKLHRMIEDVLRTPGSRLSGEFGGIVLNVQDGGSRSRVIWDQSSPSVIRATGIAGTIPQAIQRAAAAARGIRKHDERVTRGQVSDEIFKSYNLGKHNLGGLIYRESGRRISYRVDFDHKALAISKIEELSRFRYPNAIDRLYVVT